MIIEQIKEILKTISGMSKIKRIELVDKGKNTMELTIEQEPNMLGTILRSKTKQVFEIKKKG